MSRIRIFKLSQLRRQPTPNQPVDAGQTDSVRAAEAPGELQGVDSGSFGGLPHVADGAEPTRRRRGRARRN